MGQAEDLQSFKWIKENIVNSLNDLLSTNSESKFKVQESLSPMRFLERLNEWV